MEEDKNKGKGVIVDGVIFLYKGRGKKRAWVNFKGGKNGYKMIEKKVLRMNIAISNKYLMISKYLMCD